MKPLLELFASPTFAYCPGARVFEPPWWTPMPPSFAGIGGSIVSNKGGAMTEAKMHLFAEPGPVRG